MDGTAGPRFKIIISLSELKKLQRWAEWAKAAGVLEDCVANLKTLNYRLSVEADEWGEPRYEQKPLKLKIRFGQVQMLNVWFGVHEDEPLVFAKVFQFRTDFSQGQPPDKP